MKPQSERRLFVYLCTFLALLVTAGVLAYYADDLQITGKSDAETASSKRAVRIALSAPYVHTFPEMTAKLRTGRCRAPHMRFTLAVQASEHLEGILNDRSERLREAVMKQTESYQRRDLVGPEGAERLRAGMASVINSVIEPARVQRVLINKITLY